MYHMQPSGADWLSSSIMSVRGAGRRCEPTMHQLTEAKQGRYHYRWALIRIRS